MKGGVTRESKAKNSCEDHEKFDRTHKLGQRDIKDETTIVCYQHSLAISCWDHCICCDCCPSSKLLKY